MMRQILLLLMLLFSLSGPATGDNSDIRHFGLAAKTAPGVKYIGKLDDLQGIPRSQTLLDDLPNLGSARANYYQNSSVLRGALRDGSRPNVTQCTGFGWRCERWCNVMDYE